MGDIKCEYMLYSKSWSLKINEIQETLKFLEKSELSMYKFD